MVSKAIVSSPNKLQFLSSSIKEDAIIIRNACPTTISKNPRKSRYRLGYRVYLGILITAQRETLANTRDPCRNIAPRNVAYGERCPVDSEDNDFARGPKYKSSIPSKYEGLVGPSKGSENVSSDPVNGV